MCIRKYNIYVSILLIVESGNIISANEEGSPKDDHTTGSREEALHDHIIECDDTCFGEETIDDGAIFDEDTSSEEKIDIGEELYRKIVKRCRKRIIFN